MDLPIPSVGCMMYLYKRELKRRKRNYKRLTFFKWALTDRLVFSGSPHIESCPEDFSIALSASIEIKSKLEQKLSFIQNLENLGFKNVDPSLFTKDDEE